MTPTMSPETPFTIKPSTATSTATANTITIANSTATANLNSQNNQRYRYQSEIQAMMYTFGDVRHPSSSTSLLIEDIVHCQMIELVRKGNV